jgi:hypothetical protein
LVGIRCLDVADLDCEREADTRDAPAVHFFGRTGTLLPSTPSPYISEHTCDSLALLAALFPDRMLSLVMAEVERMANNRCHLRKGRNGSPPLSVT